MKRLLFVLVFSAILALPKPVLAHLLVTDDSIGAVLHVDPEDNPIAGENSSFYFEFKDTNGKFVPVNCTCIATISEDGNQIFSERLFQNTETPSLTSSSFSFTFPKRSVYQVKVSGASLDNSFAPFSLSYDIRVDREATKDDNLFQIYYHYWHYGLYFLAALIGIGLLVYERRSKSKIKTITPKEDHDQEI
jgi:hypothetical protein